jgi:hypothetical protein
MMTPRTRWLSVIPLLLYVANALHDFHQGRLGDSLWICHVSSLFLAMGIYFERAVVVRVAMVCLIPGIAFWMTEMFFTHEIIPTSVLSHFTALGIGLYVLSKVRMRGVLWPIAFLVYLTLQQMCRWITPAALNVNLSHKIYEGWSCGMHHYGEYWLLSTAAAALSFWGTEMILRVFFATKQPKEIKGECHASNATQTA